MTREEIEKKAEEIAESFRTARSFSRHPSDIAYSAAIEMAEFADQHQREGFWDAHKVTEWLEDHVREFKYYDSDFADGNIDVEGLIETLTKAMEE